MSEHTVGPWKMRVSLQPSENHRGWDIYSPGSWIGSVSPCCDLAGDATPEGIANARLIAAAPDLLAALERAVGVLREGPIYAKAVVYGVDYLLQEADATLAKVRGEP